MDYIVALPQRIVEWLSQREQLADIKFFTEFPPVMKEVPLKRAIVAVGVEDMKIVDKFVANDDSVLERQEYCRTANINARLSICVPYSYGGTACHRIFTDIIDELIFNSSLNITEPACSEIQSDRNTSALVLKGNFNISADFCPAEITDGNYFSFLDKELFCASHIKDTHIHVSDAEKELWTNSFKSGAYFGDGESSHSIHLDFEPKLLIIFSTEYPPNQVDFNAGKNYVYSAYAVKGYHTLGASVLTNGFRVKKETDGSSVSMLNELGLTYVYLAFR